MAQAFSNRDALFAAPKVGQLALMVPVFFFRTRFECFAGVGYNERKEYVLKIARSCWLAVITQEDIQAHLGEQALFEISRDKAQIPFLENLMSANSLSSSLRLKILGASFF